MFKKLWDLEIQKISLFFEYWYIWLGIFIVLGIVLFCVYKFGE